MVDIDASLVGLLVHLHTAESVPSTVGVAACVLCYRQVDTCIYVFSDIRNDILTFTILLGPTLAKIVELTPVKSCD